MAFTSRARLGLTDDGRRRGYWATAKRTAGMSGCVQNRDSFIDVGRRGQRVTGRLDPARGEGGELGWCPGRFRGKLAYYDDFACPATGVCESPEGFERLSRVVARFHFVIE